MPYNLRIPGQFTERELWAIEEVAKLVPPGGLVVEVGSCLGMSSYAWAKSVDPSVTVYCIDVWENDAEYAQKLREKYQTDYSLENFRSFTEKCPNIITLPGFSPQDFAEWDKSIDVYCQSIDYQNTMIEEDINFWSQLVKPGGIICGFGYREEFPNIKNKVDNLSQFYQVQPVIVEKFWCLVTDANFDKLNGVANVQEIHGYEYELEIYEPPALLAPGDLLKVSGKLKNISGRDWNVFVDDVEVIKIGVQVYEENKPGRLEFREAISYDKLISGGNIEFDFVLDTNQLQQRKITVVFDVLAEGWYWFEDKGIKTKTIEVQILPRTAGNLNKVGNQLKRKGKLAEAIVEYYKAIELNPQFSWSYYNLGDALSKKGYLSEVIGKYKKAIDLNSNSIWFYHSFGVALHKQKKVDEAINCFQKAKELVELRDNLTRKKYKCLMDSFLIKVRRDLIGKSTYLSKTFTDLIDPNHVNYILELGSRDGIDAIYLSKYYLCQVDTFECSPECIEMCLNNLKDRPSINLITKAAWDKNEIIPFYIPTNGNVGGASCFEETGNYPFEKYNPYQILLEAIRLDSYLTRSPDLICMDLQGAELNALKGLGRFLKGVKYIITGIEIKPLYKNQCLFDDVVEFLKEWGFELKKYVPVYYKWFGDALFVNKALVKTTHVVVEEPVVDLWEYERKVFSQNGEDGVISKIFEVIRTTNKYYVEFGVENAAECNTKNLRENLGWSGLLMDGGCENQEIGLHKEFITAENINHIFEKYNVPKKFDLLSIDIDFNDFYIWKSLDEVYQPRVVIIEHNASHSPTEDKVVKYNPNATWDGTNYCGASIRALYNLGKVKGYSLIYAESRGVNLFFVKDSILSEIEQTFKNVNNLLLIYQSPKYGYGPNSGHRHDDKNREYITSQKILFGNAYFNSLSNT